MLRFARNDDIEVEEMRKNIIAGNWKMNGSKTSAAELLDGIKTKATDLNHVTWIVFPSYPFLAQAEQLLANSNISWGAQNLSDKQEGAYTGEVSASMIQEFGCKYVLVGHSERRALYSETDEVVAAKFKTAGDAGLIPILCVGETLEERQQELTEKVVTRQLQAVLNLDQGVKRLANAVIAYEPVWAIGTGLTATPEQAQEVHAYIRNLIKELDATIASELSILYGGSMKPNNAQDLLAMSDIDGGLIGGASLDASAFIEIGKSCNN